MYELMFENKLDISVFVKGDSIVLNLEKVDEILILVFLEREKYLLLIFKICNMKIVLCR